MNVMRLTLPIHGAKTAMLWMPTTICSRNHSSRMGAYTPPRCCDPRGCTANSRARTPMEMPAMEDWGKDGALTEMAPKAPNTAALPPQLQHGRLCLVQSKSLFAIVCNRTSCKKGNRKEKSRQLCTVACRTKNKPTTVIDSLGSAMSAPKTPTCLCRCENTISNDHGSHHEHQQ